MSQKAPHGVVVAADVVSMETPQQQSFCRVLGTCRGGVRKVQAWVSVQGTINVEWDGTAQSDGRAAQNREGVKRVKQSSR